MRIGLKKFTAASRDPPCDSMAILLMNDMRVKTSYKLRGQLCGERMKDIAAFMHLDAFFALGSISSAR